MFIYIEKKHHKKTPKKTIRYLLKKVSFPETYYDKKYKKVQCKAGKKRSIGEFYHVIRTIFPYVSQEYVFKTIFTELLTDKYNKYIICCNDVNKLVINNRFYNPYGDNLKRLYLNKVIYDYQDYIINKRKLVDKFNIFYFLEKVGFSKEEINNIFYNKSNKEENSDSGLAISLQHYSTFNRL